MSQLHLVNLRDVVGIASEHLESVNALTPTLLDVARISSLDGAAKLLLVDAHNTSIMRNSRKPAFKWLEYNGGPTFTFSSDLMQAESRKRVFNVKRGKTKEKPTERRLKMTKHAVAESSYDKSIDIHVSRHGPRGYEFGPFAPDWYISNCSFEGQLHESFCC
ncbi:hypothetical protein Bca52824_010670 [Brassica carinata]|uniref:Uncharacterized protein n=1 Tax=Brassica carinata TaxID=52824 RepID=A0A8X8BBG6_BRACI|nr:hypothetical protein Bca52824_010670 [Brassica carinata]